jgi:hypothetical protein
MLDIAKRLAAFARYVLRRMFAEIKIKENWCTRYNKEVSQLFGDLHIISFVRINLLSWIGHVTRMGSTRKFK